MRVFDPLWVWSPEKKSIIEVEYIKVYLFEKKLLPDLLHSNTKERGMFNFTFKILLSTFWGA